ncbi:MAG: hypothetical protein CBC79_06770 [Gammaproteobacteria bacterium TMED119]|nr:MAG: hypothetical protein CBC79_06770 [Gammaproteobacteria bacterium TMED119]|tara:strand:- start:904 stop:1611 length:708 start_codon:yes stop_codon:yes gene_type:complete
MKSWCLVVVFVTAGCSSIEQATVKTDWPAKQAIDGIWEGSFDINGRGPYDFHAIHVNGRSTAVSSKAKAICAGSVEANDDFYLANYMLYSLDGAPFDSARLTGYLKPNRIESHFRTLSGGDVGALNMDYNPIYEQPSDLSLLVGDWQFIDRDGLTISMTMVAGQWSGVDSDECVYEGSIAVINPNYNVYDVNLSIAQCDSVSGDYQGLAYLDQAYRLRMDVLNSLYGFHFDFVKN